MRAPIRAALMLSVLPLLLAVTSWISITASAGASRSIRMTDAMTDLRSALAEQINGYATVLHGLKGFHAGSESVTSDEWTRYVSRLHLPSKHPEIKFVSVLLASESNVAGGKPTMYTEPRDVFLGEDNPLSRLRIPETIGRMKRSDEIVMERIPDDLSASEATHTLHIPLRAKVDSAADGMIIMGIDLRPVLQSLLRDRAKNDDFIIEVFDVADGEQDTAHRSEGSDFFNSASREERIRLAGDIWTMRISDAHGSSAKAIDRVLALFVLAVGASASVVIFSAVLSVTASKNRAEVLAEAMTKKWRANAAELKLFQKAVESSTTAIAFCQQNGAITWVNPAWKTLHDCTNTQACESNLFAMISNQSDSTIIRAMKSDMEKSTMFSTEEILMNRTGGSMYSSRLTVYPMAGENRKQLFVCVTEDISKQKRIDRAKSEFMSLASHQLRTPLTSMRWILEELKNAPGKMNADQRELTEDAYACSLLMADTIRTMLMLSKIETNNLALSIEDVDLKQLLEGVCNDLEPSFARKKIKVRIVGKRIIAPTDANILYQILANLIDNAAKYSREKGSVTVSVETFGKTVRFSVADNGPGIPPHEKKSMFTKFFRGESAAAKTTHGTGLGLYLVKSLVTLLHGTIRFESTVGKGTTFIVSLPLSPSSHGKNHSRGRR